MTTRNEDVARAWAKGKAARSLHMSTNGSTLFSYAQVIGITVNGAKIALDYTAPNQQMISVTTSAHVGLAKRYADRVVQNHDILSRLTRARIYGESATNAIEDVKNALLQSVTAQKNYRDNHGLLDAEEESVLLI